MSHWVVAGKAGDWSQRKHPNSTTCVPPPFQPTGLHSLWMSWWSTAWCAHESVNMVEQSSDSSGIWILSRIIFNPPNFILINFVTMIIPPWWYHDHDNHPENIMMGRWLSTQPVSSLAGRVKLHNLPIQASINELCTNLYIKSITAHRIQLYTTFFPYCAYWCAVVYGPQHQSDEAREVMWRMRGLGLEHGIAHFYKYICQCRQIETGGHMWQIWNRIGCIKITN